MPDPDAVGRIAASIEGWLSEAQGRALYTAAAALRAQARSLRSDPGRGARPCGWPMAPVAPAGGFLRSIHTLDRAKIRTRRHWTHSRRTLRVQVSQPTSNLWLRRRQKRRTACVGQSPCCSSTATTPSKGRRQTRSRGCPVSSKEAPSCFTTSQPPAIRVRGACSSAGSVEAPSSTASERSARWPLPSVRPVDRSGRRVDRARLACSFSFTMLKAT